MKLTTSMHNTQLPILTHTQTHTNTHRLVYRCKKVFQGLPVPIPVSIKLLSLPATTTTTSEAAAAAAAKETTTKTTQTTTAAIVCSLFEVVALFAQVQGLHKLKMSACHDTNIACVLALSYLYLNKVHYAY